MTYYRYCLIGLLLSLNAHANAIGNRFHQEVPDAKAAIERSLNNPTVQGFTADSYCKDQACIKEMRNPKQQQYFGNDKALVAEGQKQLVTNPNATNITSGFNNQPKRPIDPNDPAYRQAQGFMDNSYNISHGISNKYIDCEGGQLCEYIDATRQCSKPTGNPIRCTLSYIIDHYQEQQKTATVPLIKNGNDTWTFTLPTEATTLLSITLPTLSISAHTRNYCLRKQPSISRQINHRSLPKKEGSRWRCSLYDTGHSNQGNYKIYRNTSSIPAEEVVMNTTERQYRLHYTPDDYGYVTGASVTIKYSHATPVMTWRNSCGNAIPPNCIKTDTTCSNGNCTEKQETWQCESPNTCDTYLTPTRAVTGAPLTCVEKSQTCKTQILGVCLEYDVTLDCEERTCKASNLQCGETFFCIDGDCYDEEQKQNDNFSEAASGLAALGEAAKSFSAENLRVFTGNAASCSKKPIGLSDCCADSGWGNNIGLTQCSEEEKSLSDAKEKKLTIELGEYCAEKVLGVCIRKKKSYCQFDSKMTRIIQEQGKQQLGLGFGSKKHPDCSGFTPEQLQQVDFSKIDMSDFYEDLNANMELPNMQEIQDRINDKYSDLSQ
ncbi:type-F conjugative transfer system mating-pair stabilization protein TraN [Photobacterium carnosum]|uniref:Type-F conjugative transfer system mating-pair stabilization protein TraN n=2 Tax=Photobacterium TaxID=657 RepID=A0A2N4UNM1_9GAMM|nr:type-F conjugative transfer system mating-pair stabilization protein TraN [Photobacterium carnosum]MCD9554498.1 type-F conjugative transfer system mating-pair stabilization protein TraN [Photobacterium carnosum]PLC56593.1 type-F conjugative transfer system mating-pair stabilization protein TraN [Photobacterium carnosum]